MNRGACSILLLGQRCIDQCIQHITGPCGEKRGGTMNALFTETNNYIFTTFVHFKVPLNTFKDI